MLLSSCTGASQVISLPDCAQPWADSTTTHLPKATSTSSAAAVRRVTAPVNKHPGPIQDAVMIQEPSGGRSQHVHAAPDICRCCCWSGFVSPLTRWQCNVPNIHALRKIKQQQEMQRHSKFQKHIGSICQDDLLCDAAYWLAAQDCCCMHIATLAAIPFPVTSVTNVTFGCRLWGGMYAACMRPRAQGLLAPRSQGCCPQPCHQPRPMHAGMLAAPGCKVLTAVQQKVLL